MNTLYNKIKQIALKSILLTLPLGGVGGGLLSSCSDFLQTEPHNKVTQENFWNEESDVEKIIAGCYSGIESYGMLSRIMIWGEFRSENVINNGTITNDVNLERLLKENITASNTYTDWTEFYGIINRCNQVIEYAPQVAAKDASYTQSQLNAHIAEVTALRSLMYFYLIRTFRDVPYTEKAYLDDSEDMKLAATPFNQVLDTCIYNLEAVKSMAITKYPDASGLAAYYNTGRITRDAIYAMLCEMYLWKQDYQNCIKYADLVIADKKADIKESKDYSESDFKDFGGYPLVPDKKEFQTNTYGNAFNEIFVDGNSIESIFELNFDKNGGSSQQSNGPASDFFGGQGRVPYVIYSDYAGRDELDEINDIYDEQNGGYDIRQYENIAFSNGNPAYINKLTCATDITLKGTPGSNSFLFSSSWGSQYPTENLASRNKANFIIYRLSDILLMKAEALTQLMSNTTEQLDGTDLDYRNQAFALINAVNKRSVAEQTLKDTLVLKDYNTKDAITNLVYEEREREFMYEGKRFFDLVRRSRRDGNTKYLASMVKNKSTNLSSVIENKMQNMNYIYWPYYLEEIKANSKLVQNPAFGSGENSSYETTN